MQSHLRIDLFLGRVGAHSKDTVLTLQPNVYTSRQVFWHECWHTNTKIHVEPILDLLCGTLGNLMSLGQSSSFLSAQRLAFPRGGQRHKLNTLGFGRGNHAIYIDARNVNSARVQGTNRNYFIGLRDG